jgi:hypothetical protein
MLLLFLIAKRKLCVCSTSVQNAYLGIKKDKTAHGNFLNSFWLRKMKYIFKAVYIASFLVESSQKSSKNLS